MAAKKAIVLLSGGLDSTTCAAIAHNDGYSIAALSMYYGQKNRFELESAKKVATHYSIAEHLVLELPLTKIGGSSLTTEAEVEAGRSFEEIGVGIPSTYVPARNTLFLSFALAWAEVLEVCDIFIGVNAVDTSGYPDCRPEFIAAFQHLADLATRSGTEAKRNFTIHTPLQHMSKAEIVQKGIALGAPFELTSTCYNPSSEGVACAVCDACQLRQQGFSQAGETDPLPYQRVA